MLKAVIFDMDGVIIDSESIYLELERKLFKDLGLEISEEEHDSFVGTKADYMWTKIKEKYRLEPSVEELVAMEYRLYFDHIASLGDLSPIPGVKELIESLHQKGVRLALASSNYMNVIEMVLDIFKLQKYFDVITSGEQVENGKPAPDIFLAALKQLGVKAEECLVIEDSENGVKAAKTAGIKCVGFKGMNLRNQDLSLADLVVSSFYEIDYGTLRELCSTQAG